MRKLRSLQILRFLAAFAVVLNHVGVNQFGNYNVGAAGVDVFFVVSGFILTTAARRRPDGFLRLRIVRVLPMYYLALLPVAVGCALVGTLTPLRLLASVTLWPAYGQLVFPVLDLAWSLSFEMVFYVALSAVLAGVPVGLVLALYAGCWMAAFATGWPVFCFLGAPIILEFLMGVALAMWPLGGQRAGAGALAFAAIAYASSAILGVDGIVDQQIMDPRSFERVVVWGLPAAAAVFGFLQLESRFDGKLSLVLEHLGDASYSLYLFHIHVLFLVVNYLPVGGAALMLLGSVAASLVIYRTIEQPLLPYLRGIVVARA